MPIHGPVNGGAGRGGGGLLLRSPPDMFSGADRAAAQAARDAGLDAGAVAEFDANPNLAIIVTITGTDPDTTVYQARRGGAWADVTAAVRGPGGPQGNTGPGVPAGGAAGFVLAKQTAADRDTHWLDLAATIAAYGYRTAAQVTAAIGTALGAYSTTGQMNAAIAAAVGGLRGGVDSALDTLAELAAAVRARTTLADALAAVRGGAGISIDRNTAGQITIAVTGSPPTHTSEQYLAVAADAAQDAFAAADFVWVGGDARDRELAVVGVAAGRVHGVRVVGEGDAAARGGESPTSTSATPARTRSAA